MSLSLFLILYIIFLLIFAVFGVVHLAHLAHYSKKSLIGFIITSFFIVGTAVILFLTWQSLIGVDWSTPINFFSTNSSSLF